MVDVKALKVTDDGLSLRSVEKPSGNTLIRTLRVGIDGTDVEMREKGGDRLPGDQTLYPENQESMVIGHEAIGRVERSDRFEEGALVVPTVRRSHCKCRYKEMDRQDLCPPSHHKERGIKQLDGFCVEYFTEDPENLVRVPEELEEVGVLIEPLSVVEKALEEIEKPQHGVDFLPEKALVLGSGCLGILAVMLLRSKGLEVHAADIVDKEHPKAELVESTGARYFDNRSTDLEDLEEYDIAIEASGVSSQLIDMVRRLKSNGVGVSLGIPDDKFSEDIDLRNFHMELVVKNKTLLGSVNSSKVHFEEAIDDLCSLKELYDLEKMIDTVSTIENYEDAFESEIKGEITFN